MNIYRITMPDSVANKVIYYLKDTDIQFDQLYYYYHHTNSRELVFQTYIHCTEEDLTALLLSIPDITYRITSHIHNTR